MKTSKNTIQVFEHQILKVGHENKFKESHFNALEKYGYKTNEKFYSVGNKRIKFSHYVGVIQAKNLTIEILPKADLAADNVESKEKWHSVLLSMLQECRLIHLNRISNAKLKLKSASIIDLYFEVFISEVEKIIQQGMIKSYRKLNGNSDKLKGRLVFSEHIKKNIINKERFYIDYSIYDFNNKLNQILIKALHILNQLSNNLDHLRRLKKLFWYFEDIEVKNINRAWFDNLSYNRNTERYRYAVDLAKLIILKYSPDLKAGKNNVLAFLFDMNKLYEDYVYRKLKVLEKDSDVPIQKVTGQTRVSFWETRGLRSDIMVNTTTNKNIVIDTKWKILKELKPSDDDLKQMFVYDLHYKSHLSILLYPKTILENDIKRPFKDEQFQDKFCQLAFADLFDESNRLNKRLGYSLYKKLLEGEV